MVLPVCRNQVVFKLIDLPSQKISIIVMRNILLGKDYYNKGETT